MEFQAKWIRTSEETGGCVRFFERDGRQKEGRIVRRYI